MTEPRPRPGAGPGWDLERAERYLLSLELFGMRFGLDRMRRLMTALGTPQERFGSVHVVGTNGKSLDRAHDRGDPRGATGCAPGPTCRRTSCRSPSASASTTPTSARRFGGAVGASRGPPRRSTARSSEGDRVTQFEALTAAAYAEFAAPGRRRRGGRGRARRALGRDERDRAPGRGAHERRPRAHALAGPDGRATSRARSSRSCAPGAHAGPRRRPAPRRRARRGRRARRARRVVRAPPTPASSCRAGAFQRRNFARRARRGRGADRPAGRGRGRRGRRARARARAASRSSPSDPLTILDGAHNPGGMAALADSLPHVDGGAARRGACRCSTTRTPPRCCASCCRCATRSSSPRSANPRALPPATLASLAEQLGGAGAARDRARPAPRAGARPRARRARTAPSLATGSIYLDRRPAAPRRAPRRARCCERRRPGVLGDDRAVAVIVALVDPRVLRARATLFGRLFL